MHDSTNWLPYIAAGLHGLTALVWMILAKSYCRCHGTRRPESALLRLFQLLGWLFAVHYGSKAVLDFGPVSESVLHLMLIRLGDLSIVLILVVLRHLIPLGMLRESRPSRTWLAINYGFVPVGVLALWPPSSVPVDSFDLFLTTVTGLILWDLVRFARGGRRPVLMADLRFGGYLALALMLFAGVVVLGLTENNQCAEQPPIWIASHIFVGLASAAPFAVRILGEALRGLLVQVLRIGLAFGMVVGLRISSAGASGQGSDIWGGAVGSFDLMAAAALALFLGPGTAWISSWADRLVLRHDQHWRRQLQSAVHGLSPEATVEEVCQRAALEVTRVLHLPGAGILLDRDGELKVVGALDLAPIFGIWPRGEAAAELPDGAFDLLWIDDQPLQQALYGAGVQWVAPIVSPRRHWGHLFVSTGLLGNASAHTRLEALEDFTRELALVLDAADLLSRARSAERELARGEKLAALGESAARIAHEIRNPITAARSLAQLLADDPTSPLNAEHATLVVQELDRVEMQVRSMLQLASRDQTRFGSVDLTELVASTLRDLETYCSQRGVEVSRLDLMPDVLVTGDAEHLRQVLVNLLCNACEALAETPKPRTLEVRLTASPEQASLEISDSGPGVPEVIRPRLFEPFVSTKIRGTGLGLAISKRIVESHGGKISATTRKGGGMCFLILLPRAHGGETRPGPIVEFPESPRRMVG